MTESSVAATDDFEVNEHSELAAANEQM